MVARTVAIARRSSNTRTRQSGVFRRNSHTHAARESGMAPSEPANGIPGLFRALLSCLSPVPLSPPAAPGTQRRQRKKERPAGSRAIAFPGALRAQDSCFSAPRGGIFANQPLTPPAGAISVPLV